MPVVPIRGNRPQPQVPMPDPQFALMAAAQMHREGRLVESSNDLRPMPQRETPNEKA